MMDVHLSHICVLLASPAPSADLFDHIPILDEDILPSGDADPVATADDGKDPVTDDRDPATDGGEEEVDAQQT